MSPLSKFVEFQKAGSGAARVPAEMDALVLAGKGFDKLYLRRLPVPRPGRDQFLARVDAVFACTSDGKLIESGSEHPLLAGWDTERWPVVIGHEGCVTAVEVGDGLNGQIEPGQAFALQPAINAGPINFLERYPDAKSVRKTAVGYSLGGLFAEYVLIMEEVIETGSLIPYDTAKVPYFAAAFSEPLSCVYSSQN